MGLQCSIDLISFGNPNEREPDLVFSGCNETVAFEITTVAENEINQVYAEPHGDMIYPTTIAKIVITRKLNKHYNSEHSIELLICHNGAMDHDAAILEDLNSVISATEKIRFRRIWYFGEEKIFEFSPSGKLLNTAKF